VALKAEHKIPDTGGELLATWLKIPELGYDIPDFGYVVLDFGGEIQDSR